MAKFRPKDWSPEEKIAMVLALLGSGSITGLARQCGVSETTIYKWRERLFGKGAVAGHKSLDSSQDWMVYHAYAGSAAVKDTRTVRAAADLGHHGHRRHTQLRHAGGGHHQPAPAGQRPRRGGRYPAVLGRLRGLRHLRRWLDHRRRQLVDLPPAVVVQSGVV